MSAYVVSRDHVDYLVTAFSVLADQIGHTIPVPLDYGEADHLDGVVLSRYGGNRFWHPAHDPDGLGRMLLRLNVTTVAERYPDLDEAALPGPIPTPLPEDYTHHPVSADLVTAAQTVTAIHCWRYQSEHADEYTQSLAWRAMDELREVAIRLMLPSGLTWEWNRPASVLT